MRGLRAPAPAAALAMTPAASLLAGLLLIAFALQLLTVISTPIVKAITIASDRGIDYGVFGFCQGTLCTKISIGYQGQGKDCTTGQEATAFALPNLP